MYHNYINEINSLLAIRLRGFHLQQAQSIALSSLTELGGGPRRVEQRLRNTIHWCKSPDYPRARFDSAPQEIAASWVYRPAGSPHITAPAHHLDHARKVWCVAAELRLPEHQRIGLVKSALATAYSAQRLADQNVQHRNNRRLAAQGAAYRQKWADSDANSLERVERRKIALGRLTALRRSGHVAALVTISLPASYHPKTRFFGLPTHGINRQPAPCPESGADLLRQIHKQTMGSLRSLRGKLSGFWTIDDHKSGVVHLHAVISAPTDDDLLSYVLQVHETYLSCTASSRSIKVIGAFGIELAIDKPAINIKRIGPTQNDLTRSVSYCLRHTSNLAKKRCYSSFGKLRGNQILPSVPTIISFATGQLSAVAPIGNFTYIKLYQETACLVVVLVSISAFISERYLRPPVRAPPNT